MQRLLNFFVAVSAGLGLAAATAWAQPANDYFPTATVITGIPGSTNATTMGATTREAGDPFPCGWSSPFGATEGGPPPAGKRVSGLAVGGTDCGAVGAAGN